MKGDYSYLKLKIFFAGLGVAVAASAITLFFYFLLWKNRGGDWLVAFLHDVIKMDTVTAYNVYYQLFQKNPGIMWLLASCVIFFIILDFLLTWITRYLKRIEETIDAIMMDREISLPAELSVIEGKLKVVRQTMDRQAMETQLAEQRKNDLVMYLAHDIRTPLTSVIGYLSLLDEAKDMPGEQKEKYIRITLDKANRLETLVNEFFEITRYNLQQIQLQAESIDLYYMLVQLTDEFYPILSVRGNTAILHADEELTVRGDPAKLARVFNNILKNAAAYSYPGSEIVITADKEGDFVKITFQNRGPTIPQGKLSTIFEKFFRLDEARVSDTGGAGLGLAIAKEIVTLHGGTISAQSETNLTTFTVTLPMERSTP